MWLRLGRRGPQTDLIALRTRAKNPLTDKGIDELGVPLDIDVEEVRTQLAYREFLDGLQGPERMRHPLAHDRLSVHLAADV